MTWILVFFLLAHPEQQGVYSGDGHGNNTGQPTLFVSEADCLKVQKSETVRMTAMLKANPKLGAFKLECRAVRA